MVFFVGKLRQLPTTFMNLMGFNSDVSNDVLASKQYQQPANNVNNQQPTMSKTSHQINGWPPTK